MRGTLLALASAAVVGVGIAVAGPAGAVSEQATCVTVGAVVDEFSKQSEANDAGDAATRWSELGRRFSELAADADDGKVKNALNDAAAQLNRLAAAPARDHQALLGNPDVKGAFAAVDSACGF
ncbi:hypothetical protein D5S18_26540 [Nocardia panacis]|uniref:Hemophore-related protein n=1 Tax=Nocardia panacis TaxID=2340916 RepID=A0A3A4K2T4_9NOCA|nr:hypothetical protein [Nocardia panacis]RJO70764.1 hypothetical protein D5S18_26540 [Nocardia panacis]